MWLLRHFILKPEYQKVGIEFSLAEQQFGLLILDVLLVALLGYWLNDWFDREIDKINKPHRFLVLAPIKPTRFWLLISGILIIILSLSIYLAKVTNHLIDLWVLPLAIFCVAFYAHQLKRFKPIGNVLVSLLIVGIMGLVLLSENIISGGDLQLSPLFHQNIWLYASLIFTLNLSREIVKDLEDIDGDRKMSVISLPSALGAKASRGIVILLLGIAIVLELFYAWPQMWQWTNMAVFGVILLMLIVTILRLVKSNSIVDFRTTSTLLKWAMVFGVLQLAALT